MMKFALDTQKCEAVNRTIGCRAPKQLTFSRNYNARVHAAAKAVNRGLGQSICDGVHYMGGKIPAGSTAAKRLYACDKSAQSTKKAHSTMACKQRLKQRKYEAYRNYDEQQAEMSYKTGVVLETLNEQLSHVDHSYCLERKYFKC